MKVGDRVKLTGLTKHGKNRVREQGDMGTVTALSVAHASSFAPIGSSIALLRADSNPTKHWRWVEVKNDKNFHMRVLASDIKELEGAQNSSHPAT